MDSFRDSSDFLWILVFAVGLPFLLLFAQMFVPRKQLRVFSSSMPAVLAFIFILLIVDTLLNLVTIFLDFKDDNIMLGVFLLNVLVAAGISCLFVRRFVISGVMDNVAQAEKEEAEALKKEPAGDTFKNRVRNGMFIGLPYVIIFAGAGFTRFNGHLFYSYISTIAIAMALVAGLSRPRRDNSNGSSEPGKVMTISVIATLVFPFTITYFMFILILCNADPDTIRSLF